MLQIFGEEMRPVTIQTVVRGFPASKNDFLFERRLNDKVYAVLLEHWQEKPVLVFCSSRKGAALALQTEIQFDALHMHRRHPFEFFEGTVECCNKISEGSSRGKMQSASCFVRNEAQKARLKETAASLHDKSLSEMVVRGIAWHNASMDAHDRSTIEQLFLSRDVMCLVATATLAQVCVLALLFAKQQDGIGVFYVPGCIRWTAAAQVA
jgi:ATP-dependent DNA helicase HFM1/MER3